MQNLKNLSIYCYGICLLSLSCWGLPAQAESGMQEVPQEALTHAQGLSLAFEKVADSISPAVVNIQAVKRAKVAVGRKRPMPLPFRGAPGQDLFSQDFFERFFHDQNPGDGQAQQGMGTGVIIDAQGHIITNNHVVGDFDEITVRLADKRSFKAEVIGTDPKTDLAVIQIKADKLSPATLSPAKLGDSDALRVGEWVVAAGNPFGLDSSITVGIVSAKGRSNLGITDYEDFIQTDAAINPGNSGGPLVNLRGEVVGINSAIYSRSGGYMGIGFAIPSKMVKSVLDAIISKGRVVRGWLGVAIQDLDDDMAKSFGFEGKKGALIGDVTPDSPAADAGLKQGDIIVRFNGQEVVDVTNLRRMVADSKPGQSIELSFVRDGKQENAKVNISEMQGEEKQPSQPDQESSQIGLTVTKVTPEIAQQLGLEAARGVVVTELTQGGIADSSGLRERDIILNVNGTDVNDAATFKRLVNSRSVDDGVRMVVQSGGMQRFVIVKSRQ